MKGAEEQMKKIIAWMTGLLMVLGCCVALAEGTAMLCCSQREDPRDCLALLRSLEKAPEILTLLSGIEGDALSFLREKDLRIEVIGYVR